MISKMQQRFVAEYLADPNPKRNAKAAALRAGYSKSSAGPHSCRMLQDPEIQGLINKELTRHLEKLDVDAQMVLKGILDAIDDAKHSGRGAWQSATIVRGYELLGRYLGLFHDRVEVDLDTEIMARLEEGRRRAAGLTKNDEEEAEEQPPDEPKPN